MNSTAFPNSRRQPWLLDAMLAALVVLSILGYPMVATFPTFLSIDTRVVSVPYRALVMALSLAALGLAALNQRRMPAPAIVKALFVVSLLILVLRFINDAVVLGLPPHSEIAGPEFAIFFFGVTLLPALPLFIPVTQTFWPSLHRNLLYVGGVTLFIASLAVTFGQDSLDLTTRQEVEGLNAITYGCLGAVLVMLIWSTPHGAKNSAIKSMLRWLGILAGLGPMLAAASRGPIIAMIVVLVTYQVACGRNSWRTISSLIIGAALVVVSGTLLLERGAAEGESIALVQRLADGEETSTTERLAILGSSLNIFLENPLLGGAMVEPIFKTYPHNVLIEALMVGGVFFGVMMLALLGLTTIEAVRLIAKGHQFPMQSFVGMYSLFYLVMSMISGSLYRGPEFWSAVALAFAYGPLQRRRKFRGPPARVLVNSSGRY